MATRPAYERHRPEQTLLYQIIDQNYADFLSAMEAQGRPLPGDVQKGVRRFSSMWPSGKQATHIIYKAGFTKSTAQTGAVALIQRFWVRLELLFGLQYRRNAFRV